MHHLESQKYVGEKLSKYSKTVFTIISSLDSGFTLDNPQKPGDCIPLPTTRNLSYTSEISSDKSSNPDKELSRCRRILQFFSIHQKANPNSDTTLKKPKKHKLKSGFNTIENFKVFNQVDYFPHYYASTTFSTTIGGGSNLKILRLVSSEGKSSNSQDVVKSSGSFSTVIKFEAGVTETKQSLICPSRKSAPSFINQSSLNDTKTAEESQNVVEARKEIIKKRKELRHPIPLREKSASIPSLNRGSGCSIGEKVSSNIFKLSCLHAERNFTHKPSSKNIKIVHQEKVGRRGQKNGSLVRKLCRIFCSKKDKERKQNSYNPESAATEVVVPLNRNKIGSEISLQSQSLSESSSQLRQSQRQSSSHSQEIIFLDNEPKVRTPSLRRTQRQKNIPDKDTQKILPEMEGVSNAMEMSPSSENVANKLPEKDKKSKTFSSVTSLQEDIHPSSIPPSNNSNSHSGESNGNERKSLQNSEQVTITKDNAGNTEPDDETILPKDTNILVSTEIEPDKETVSNEMEKTVQKKKKSWSEIVGSSSPSPVNNKDNGILLLETKLDQDQDHDDDDAEKKDVSNYSHNGIPATDQYQSRNGSLAQDAKTDPPIDLRDETYWNLSDDDSRTVPNPHQLEIESEVTNNSVPSDLTPEVDEEAFSPAVVELSKDYKYARYDQGFEAVLEMNGRKISEKKDHENDDEVDEPSCTLSFKQLNPFDFPAHVEKGKRERLYKVLVVGELGSGKTSIIKRYVHQFFSQHYRATIGVDFALKVLRWDGDTVVRLQLWDIAGQERFGSMTRVYYKEAVGAFVVFDVTRSATLEAVPKWKADLDSKVALPDGRPIPTVLLANKSDQPKEGIAANREKMNEFCQQQGFSAWFETSAKENINIDESANFLVSKILEMDRWSQEPSTTDPDKVDLSANGKHKINASSNCPC